MATNSEFQCSQCKKKIPHEDMRKGRKGCLEAVKHIVFEGYGHKFNICPTNFFNNAAFELISTFGQYKRGVLPYSQSYFEHPAKVILAYNFIESLEIEYQNKIQEKIAARAKKKGKKK